MATATYLVPDCNLQELRDRIAKLNKRAAKLGVAEITLAASVDHVKARVRVLTVNGEINSQCWELPEKIAERNAKWLCQDTGERMTWWKVEVTGETPRLNGWEFLAVLEPMVTEDGAALNLLQCIPGQTIPAEFRTRLGECDHCRMARRRKQTFVVRNEAGEHKCVGRQCLKDFLGYNGDPHDLAAAAEMLAELGQLCGMAEDEDGFGFGRGGYRADCWDLKMFLSLTACRIRLFGWLSRTSVRERGFGEATADCVLEILTPPNSRYASAREIRKHEELCAKHIQADADKAMAEAAIDWAKAIPAGELDANNYLANVNLVARMGIVEKKTAGLAASILVAYTKALEREVQRQQFAQRPESNWVGTIGKRQEMVLTCERKFSSSSAYGETIIHKLVDEQGNDLTWFASESAEVLDDGKTYRVKATVKGHGEYKGRKQTTVNRIKIVEEIVQATEQAEVMA